MTDARTEEIMARALTECGDPFPKENACFILAALQDAGKVIVDREPTEALMKAREFMHLFIADTEPPFLFALALEAENAALKKALDIAEGCERNAGKLAKLLNDDMVALRDENKRLREALEPFKDLANAVDNARIYECLESGTYDRLSDVPTKEVTDQDQKAWSLVKINGLYEYLRRAREEIGQ